MDLFPAFFPLKDSIIAIVGEGEAANAKTRLFEGSPARLVRIADRLSGEVEAYAGSVLAFVANEDASLHPAARQAAKAAGALVNVVDQPHLCDFTTPALIDRGALVIAFGTGGASPVLASLLRARLEPQIPQALGQAARLLGAFQAQIRAAYPQTPARRAFLRSVLRGPWIDALGDLGHDEAGTRLCLLLEQGSLPSGGLYLVRGDIDPDLMTLREARALSDVDLLGLCPGVDPGVLQLARRDCVRLDDPHTHLGRLRQALEAGEQVVVLTARADPWPEWLAELPTPARSLAPTDPAVGP